MFESESKSNFEFIAYAHENVATELDTYPSYQIIVNFVCCYRHSFIL